MENIYPPIHTLPFATPDERSFLSEVVFYVHILLQLRDVLPYWLGVFARSCSLPLALAFFSFGLVLVLFLAAFPASFWRMWRLEIARAMVWWCEAKVVVGQRQNGGAWIGSGGWSLRSAHLVSLAHGSPRCDR